MDGGSYTLSLTSQDFLSYGTPFTLLIQQVSFIFSTTHVDVHLILKSPIGRQERIGLQSSAMCFSTFSVLWPWLQRDLMNGGTKQSHKLNSRTHFTFFILNCWFYLNEIELLQNWNNFRFNLFWIGWFVENYCILLWWKPSETRNHWY